MEAVLPILSFVVVSCITPGPNNVLLAASGVRFGFRATVPHVAGIHLGMYIIVGLCGLGLGQVLLSTPNIVVALKIAGTVYLLYLAWKIVDIRMDAGEDRSIEAPMSFVEAGVFQFANPKVWIMATTGLNLAFTFDSTMSTAVEILCIGFATLGLCCNCLWVLMGKAMQTAWGVPVYRAWINAVLVGVTVATATMFWLL